MPTEAKLVGGPQDGAAIRRGGTVLPPRVHLGPRPLGDGYSAWSSEPCPRFPAAYLYDGRRSYRFVGWRAGYRDRA